MIKKFLSSLLVGLLLFVIPVIVSADAGFIGELSLVEGGSSSFDFQVKTTTTDEDFVLPLESGGTYDFTVDWGDGSTNDITTYNDVNITHTYASIGTHNVKITGTITGWKSAWSDSAPKIYEISSWGNFQILPASGATFFGCSNMTWVGSAVGGFDTALVTNMSLMFRDCTAFNQSVAFDTAKVTNMSLMFRSCTAFNQAVAFDTAKVTNMSNMFNGCTAFNQAVAFDTAKVTNMTYMFRSCTAFNQAVAFDTALVTDMSYMFNGCTLSTSNYDALILTFSADVQTIVANFHGGNSKYTGGGAVATARAAWVTKGWILTDAGIAD